MRLQPRPGERIDRSQPVSFTFEGKIVEGLAGDTIGSALFASGQRIFSRSFKYHRRRGLLCCSGHCPNCGPREVEELRCAGEVTTRPAATPTVRELNEYVYFRGNVAGVQREWWF